MTRMFVASIIARDSVEDSYSDGVNPDTNYSREENEANITAPTLIELINKLKDVYKVEQGAITVQPDSTDLIILTRHETSAGNVPTPAQIARWKEGKSVMMLVDYTIKIRIEETVDFTKMSDDDMVNWNMV